MKVINWHCQIIKQGLRGLPNWGSYFLGEKRQIEGWLKEELWLNFFFLGAYSGPMHWNVLLRAFLTHGHYSVTVSAQTYPSHHSEIKAPLESSGN